MGEKKVGLEGMCDGATLSGCQVRTKATPTGWEIKYDKRLVG